MGPKTGTKISPRLGHKLLMFGSILDFLEVLELCGCILGAFLGVLRFSWEASGRQKPTKSKFLRFWKMQLFGPLKILMDLLVSSCPLLGPIWSQNGPQNGLSSGPKSNRKVVQKTAQRIAEQMQILVRNMGPKTGRDGDGGPRTNLDGGSLKALGPKMRPRCPKMAPISPR